MNVTSLFRRRERHGLHVAGRLTAAPQSASACRACSREDYGPCTCPADCGWLSCTGGRRDAQPITPEVRAELARLTEQATAEQRAAAPPWYGYSTTMPDNRAPHDRPYVPGPRPYVPDIREDIRDLPGLRDAIRVTMQRGGTECGHCGRTVPGRDWLERFAAQLAHLAAGMDAPSAGAWRPAEPQQADVAETAETEVAA